MIPNIYKNDIFWEGNIQLDDWNDYFHDDLRITLNIGGDSIIDEINRTHRAGYDYLVNEQLNILQIVTNAIFSKYSIWQNEFGYEGVEREKLMPDITSKFELNNLIHPNKIFIMDVEQNGIPYIGFEFKCKWDEEHGVGVMMHKDRVVAIGSSDTAFMSWIAEEDLE